MSADQHHYLEWSPSVDRVGRYFPLTVVCEMPEDTNVIAAATDATAFFETSEQLIVEALAQVETDFDGFDGRLVRLGEALAFASARGPVILDRTASALLADKGGIGLATAPGLRGATRTGLVTAALPPAVRALRTGLVVVDRRLVRGESELPDHERSPTP